MDKFFKELDFLEPKLFFNDLTSDRQVIIEKNKVITAKNNKYLNHVAKKISYVKGLSYESFDKKSKFQIDENSYTFAEFITNLLFHIKSLSIFKENPDFNYDVEPILSDLNNLIYNNENIGEFKNHVNTLNIMLEKYKLI